jgi:hypothetical protein
MVKREVDSVALWHLRIRRGVTGKPLFVYLEWQISPQLLGLSRDGGASVLLKGRLVWLFDDTEVTPRMMSYSFLCPAPLHTPMLLREISHCCAILGFLLQGN